MKNLIQLVHRARAWLETDALSSFLADPSPRIPYDRYAGERVVAIAIDVSPSMEETDYHPTRLEGAKRAARRYLDTKRQVEPQTLVGLLDFHGEAQRVSSPLPVAEHHRELRSALNRLHTGYGTNIGAALQLAMRELSRVPSACNPTVILLTDGGANAGPDPVSVAAEVKGRGIQLDIIGIGGSPADVNEADLKRMASVVHGQLRYWFIKSSEALVERFEALALREIR